MRDLWVCVGGGGKQPREAGGRAAAPAPESGAPWATLSTSPLLAPALPGHLPPTTPRLLSARGEAPPTRRKRQTGGRGARRRVLHSPAESDCLLRLHLLLLRCLLPSSPPAAAFPFSFACRRHRCRRCRSTNYIRATQRLRPSANLGSFRRAPPLPPSALLPSPRSSGRPPSANLGSLGFSSSFEAWLAAWRALSAFRWPLLFLTLTSGRCCSSLRRVLPGDPLEAGSRGPGVRGEGAVFGRRTVGRQRSHRGLSTGGRATARAPRWGRGRGRAPWGSARATGSRPSGLGGVVAKPSVGGGRTVSLERPSELRQELPSGAGDARPLPRALGPEPDLGTSLEPDA